MNYYNEIKNKIIDHEIYSKVKDYSKEKHRVITYFEIGRLLNEAGKNYGKDIIGEYSKMLVIEVGKKYNARTLRSMRQLYTMFNDEIWKPLVSKLSWTIFLILMPLKDNNKMYYYANQCLINNLSKRQLKDRIKSNEYDRLDVKTQLKLINQEQGVVSDFIKNPILIKNSYYYEKISEKVLKHLILDDMDNFLMELGDGFCYIRNEYKFKLGDRYNYIDLLLFNIKYKCYVVVELKVTELKSEYIGQIEKYMNYIDKIIKTIEEDKTIGIIICKQDNEYIIKYCSDDRIIARRYELV